jgi:recombination protein RecT
MPDEAPAPARPERSIARLKDCRSLNEALSSDEFKIKVRESLPSHLTADRMLQTFRSCIGKTPKLREVPMFDLLGAFMTCGLLGLEPNTPLQLVHLIPFNKRVFDKESRRWVDGVPDVQLIIGYPGLLDLVTRSKLVTSVHADVVWPADDDGKHFDFHYGTDSKLYHRPTGRHAPDEHPRWAYMHATLTDGQSFNVMPYPEVLDIRDRSQGYKSALMAKNRAENEGKPPPAAWTEAPWVRHEIAMARKTALRAGIKWLPKSIQMANAVAIDEIGERGRVDYGKVISEHGEILSGNMGLDALEEQVVVDPLSGFGTRQRDPETVDVVERQEVPLPKPAKNEKAPPKKQAPPLPPAPTEPPLGIQFCDQFGEFEPTVYTDGVVFANVLRNRFERCATQAERLTLLENNSDAMMEIEDHPRAAAIIKALMQAPPMPDPQPTTSDSIVDQPPTDEALSDNEVDYTVPVPMKPGGRPDASGYVAAMLARLADVPEADMMDFRAANAPSLAQMGPTVQARLDKAWADRMATFAPPGTDEAEPEAEPAEPAIDRDRVRADEMIAEIKNFNSPWELESFGMRGDVRTVLARFTRERPELAQELKEHGDARLAMLRAGA